MDSKKGSASQKGWEPLPYTVGISLLPLPTIEPRFVSR